MKPSRRQLASPVKKKRRPSSRVRNRPTEPGVWPNSGTSTRLPSPNRSWLCSKPRNGWLAKVKGTHLIGCLNWLGSSAGGVAMRLNSISS
ncbi:hypothetical protein D3C78_1784540 [compost metagenome]